MSAVCQYQLILGQIPEPSHHEDTSQPLQQASCSSWRTKGTQRTMPHTAPRLCCDSPQTKPRGGGRQPSTTSHPPEIFESATPAILAGAAAIGRPDALKPSGVDRGRGTRDQGARRISKRQEVNPPPRRIVSSPVPLPIDRSNRPSQCVRGGISSRTDMGGPGAPQNSQNACGSKLGRQGQPYRIEQRRTSV